MREKDLLDEFIVEITAVEEIIEDDDIMNMPINESIESSEDEEYDLLNETIDIDTEYLAKSIKSIGLISSIFTEENDTYETFIESAEPSGIKEVTRKDVTGKHFVNWFFEMDDWKNVPPEEFPFSEIINSEEFYVYGYFNDNKLDGIIRVEDYGDYYELSYFFVNKELQHQGIGQCLFQFVLNSFRDKKLILYVYKDNSPAIHIYKKYGFKIIGTDDGKGFRPYAPHYIMQRHVNDSH